MKKSIITSLLIFSSYFLIGQNLVSIECKEKKDADVVCFWYIENKHDKTVEVVYARTFTNCDNITENKKTKTVKLTPNKRKNIGWKTKNTCKNKTVDYGSKYKIISTKFINKE